MKLVEFQSEPIFEFIYLNAGQSPGGFYAARLPVNVAKVDRLPDGVAAIVATADLQGRERFEDSRGGPLRLLGEVLPQRLVEEVLPLLSLHSQDHVGVLLAGDFYTVPALDKRGGSGDVTDVWQAFADCFTWVAGVAGNHDTFGESPKQRPRFPARIHYLDGDMTEVDELRIAGLGGIIGNPSRPHRRTEDDYLATLERLLHTQPHLLLMHDGPNGHESNQRGISEAREMLLNSHPTLVVRGHSHWPQAFAEFDSGLQILNVHERVVILTN